jgi:hypothetical protein
MADLWFAAIDVSNYEKCGELVGINKSWFIGGYDC